MPALWAGHAWFWIPVMLMLAGTAFLWVDADFNAGARIGAHTVGHCHRDSVPPHGQIMRCDLVAGSYRPDAIARPDNFIGSRGTEIW